LELAGVSGPAGAVKPLLHQPRINAQLPTYCSWRADPAALAVDG